MYVVSLALGNFRHGASRVWLGGLAIVLSVAFVVAGALVSDAAKQRLIEPSLSAPIGTTGIVSAASGQLPPTAAQLGVVTSEDTAVILGPDSEVELAGARQLFAADSRAVRVVAGRLPATGEEIALDDAAARILGLAPGDTVAVRSTTAEIVVMTMSGIIAPRTAAAGIAVTVSGMARLAGPGIDSVQLRGTPTENAAAAASLGGSALLTDVRADLAAQTAEAGQGLGTIGLLISALTLVSTVAGTFVIANTFYVVAASRRREAALLRAVGATSNQVRGMLIAEAVILGAVASAAGVVAGWVTGSRLGARMGAEVSPDLSLVMLGMALGMLVTLVGTWGPVRGVAYVAPVAALGRADVTEAETPSQVRWTLVIPLLVITAGVLQVPFVGAVLGGLLVFVALVILGPLLVPRVGAMVMRGRGPVIALARANVVRYPKRSARTSVAVVLGVALAASVTALVTAARNLADLIPHGRLTMYAPTVTEEKTQTLGALDGVIEVEDNGPSQMTLVADPGDADFLSTAVAEQLPMWPGARLGTEADAAAEYAVGLGWIITSLGSVAAMALIVGLLGVLNTVRLSALERRREFAVLRAVGMTRGQLVRLVMGEAFGMSGIGVILGLALGAATIYGMLGVFTLALIPLVSWWLRSAPPC